MATAAVARDFRLTAYLGLMAVSRRQGFNEHALASMLASQRCGEGGMPARLGLDPEMFARMLDCHFTGLAWPVEPSATVWNVSSMPEYDELKSLLLEYRAPHVIEQPWWVELVIVGCSGRNHLWEDLGLFERRDLNLLLQENFPQLAAKNSRDMKWKKFLYKQLCEREGIIACPAPTCDQCAQFSECFSPE